MSDGTLQDTIGRYGGRIFLCGISSGVSAIQGVLMY